MSSCYGVLPTNRTVIIFTPKPSLEHLHLWTFQCRMRASAGAFVAAAKSIFSSQGHHQLGDSFAIRFRQERALAKSRAIRFDKGRELLFEKWH
jgi:hypothetical protein